MIKQTYANITIYRHPKKSTIKFDLQEGFSAEEILSKINFYRKEGYSLVEFEFNPETIGIEYKGVIQHERDLEELLINLEGVDARLQEPGKFCILQIMSEHVTINQLYNPRFLGWLNGAFVQFFESR